MIDTVSPTQPTVVAGWVRARSPSRQMTDAAPTNRLVPFSRRCPISQELPQRRELRQLVAERFECGGDRDREEHAWDAPDEPPKQYAHHYRERVDLQPARIHERRQHVVLQQRDSEIADGRKQRVANAWKRGEAGDREEAYHGRGSEVGNELQGKRQQPPH